MIPLVHDFSGDRVLVFGGGPVGARKARRFAAEARVVVISPTFTDASFGGAERVRAAPGENAVSWWLERFDPALVVAATDDATVNGAIETAALDAGVLVNRADDRGSRAAGSVVLPAIVRTDPLVVGVSSEGRDPVLSQAVRERLEEVLAGTQPVVEAATSERSRLERAGVDEAVRLEVVRGLYRSEALWEATQSEARDVSTVASNETARLVRAMDGPTPPSAEFST